MQLLEPAALYHVPAAPEAKVYPVGRITDKSDYEMIMTLMIRR
jgi:hypothetical protein